MENVKRENVNRNGLMGPNFMSSRFTFYVLRHLSCGDV